MDAGDADRGHRVGLRDVPRVPRARPLGAARSLNFTAYVGHTAVRLYVMGDAAYERAATADEIAADVPRSCTRRSTPARPGSPPASPTRTAAIDGKPVPSRFAERDEVEALFLAAGEHGQGRGARHRRASSAPTPTCTSCSRGSGARSPIPLFALRRRHATDPQLELHEEGRGARRAGLAAGHAAAAHVAVHDGRARSASTSSPVFGELMDGEPRGAPRRVRAIPSGGPGPPPTSSEPPMKPRWETFEVSESSRFPELEGRRVDDLARERGVGPSTSSASSRSPRTSHTRFRIYIANDDDGAVRQLLTHDARRARPLRRGRARRPAVRRAAAHRPARQLGARASRSCRSSRRCASSPASPPTCSASSTAATCARATWADVCVFDPATVAPGPDPAGARLPGRRRAPHRRGARRRAPRARQRHADPPRRGAARLVGAPGHASRTRLNRRRARDSTVSDALLVIVLVVCLVVAVGGLVTGIRLVRRVRSEAEAKNAEERP